MLKKAESLIPTRIINGSCGHPFCQQQNISNPHGNTLKSYCCQSPIKGPGVYDCHSHDKSRLKEIQNTPRAQALVILDEPSLASDHVGEDLILQIYLAKKPNDTLSTFKKIKEPFHLFMEPKNFSLHEVITFHQELLQNDVKVLDQSVFTGAFYQRDLSSYHERNPERQVIQEASKNANFLSIIIPHFNHHRELKNTLFTLEQAYRHYPLSLEVIIIDDGSNPELFLPETELPLTFLRLKREHERYLGDKSYRAGVARNQALPYAHGRYLLFLDADMLAPKDFFKKLEIELKGVDILQLKRLHLKESIPLKDVDSLLKDEKSFYSRSHGYFEAFQNDPKAWRETLYGWKYFSTFGVAVKKELLMKTGCFSPHYCLYGFEDVDLGYRLWQTDALFKKSSIPVIAQFHESERSEYANNNQLKKEMLKTTGSLFFRTYPTMEVWKALRGVIS